MTMAAVLSDVFDRRAETAQLPGAFTRLTREEEAAAIADVVSGGDAGLVTLLYAYAPALRGAVGRYRATLGEDEARSVAIAALVETCHAVKPGDYLAGVLVQRLTDALSTAAGETYAVSIPARSLKRFLGIVRRADGDFARAALIAPEHAMTRETFYAIADALSAWGSTDEHVGDEDGRVEPASHPLWGDADRFGTVEDALMVRAAFEAVDDLETDVVRLRYGFSDYRERSDAEVAMELGLTRPTAQRLRAGALSKMRDRLAVDVEVS